ncbi:Uncharacterised protein [Vibrio cholerae]|uniref:Uncharacterized protein n=1 Tax=Vibrio cholerae TaxID=666 RepID=A0A655YJ79_VIBCL|nr:Uncharacterised protein [Vibrio cholerae]CSI80402.1 Uncharacterised protein [Vibrio cholerae]
MWANTANQHVVTVKQQMVRGNRCRNVIACLLHKGHCIGGGDVFKHNFQLREIIHDRRKHGV